MSTSEWILIGGMAAVTFGIRYFLLAVAERVSMPEIVRTALNYIPPAVLTAITVPAVLLPQGEWFLSLSNPYLIAGIVATAAGVLSKNLLVTIASGLGAFFLYQLIF